MFKRIFIFLCFLILYSLQAVAQLQANFTIDKPAGCSPLDVQFTNTTSGASPSVVYKWNFGNGNSSALENPGATYGTSKTYTVTLTATDNGVKSSVNKTIIVYEKPTVNFSASPILGCAPLNVNFISSVTPGDGTIGKYLWDFGDGKTAQGANLDTISHTYTVPQKPPVSLTVTNSFGCYATDDKNKFVEVLRPVKANFLASGTTLCSVGNVQFTNTSTGGGTLSYVWSFGDGQTSNAKSPMHSFLTPGNFTVKLTVKNDAGCTASTKSVVINVGNIKADFNVPAAGCTGRLITFTNTSTKNYDSLRWTIDGIVMPYAPTSGNMPNTFITEGNYTVKLVAFYKNCIDSSTKVVKIGAVPESEGFIIQNINGCTLPATYSFTDTTKNAISWKWRYEAITVPGDTTQNVAHTFTDAGISRIRLIVTNSDGCSKSLLKTISIDTASIGIVIRKSNSGSTFPNRGCLGLNVTFATTNNANIASFAWSFGDGGSSALAIPAHMYNEFGSYQVTLDYITKNGCKGVAKFDSIYISDVQSSDFNVSPSPVICGNSKVVFTPTLSMLNRDYIWLINGTEAYVSSTPSPFEYHFDSAGVYTIGLVIRAGACKDTLTKIDYVTVLPPFPDIKSALNTCDGTRGLVSITDATRGTASWNWSFGDGNSLNYSSFTKNINHTYTKSGSYKVKLTATNGNCTVADSISVNVLLKQKPLLTAESSSICTSDSLFINLLNFELHPAADSSQPYLISRLQFKDLTTSNATINAGKWSTSVRTGIYGLESGKEDIRIITTSHHFQCEDTSNFAKLKIAGPIADFAFNPQQCFNVPAILQDKSVAATSSPITKWEWFYGDSTSTVALNGNSISHQYKLPGTYQLSLRVTDAGGCVYQTPADSAHKVNLTGPAAFFEASGYHVPVNSTVNFINKSVYFQNSELLWRFSDGSVSTNTNPSFFYNSEGDYKVMLITKNLLSGCTDTAENIIYVKKFQSLFTYTATYINQNNCPPVIVNFKSQSINANKVSWTFGDGGEAGNQVAVEHVYTNPGLYRIVHYSYDTTGRIDSAIQIFEVKGPYATITADTSYACNALQVRLSADTINASSFKWDFGDGTITQTTDTFATHLYTVPGVYTPGLILSDAGGCNATSQLDKKIIIDSLAVKISALPDAIICDSSLVSFTSSVYSLAEDTLGKAPQFLWTSSMHLNRPQATRIAAWYFDKKGVHDVTFEVRSNYGCKEVITKQVVVKQGVTAGIKVPKVLCSGDSIMFEGIATPAAGTMQWHWQFAGNRVSDLQYPPGIIYATGGLQPVSLIVNNGFCADTAYALADILNRPTVSLLASKPYLCEGDSAMLSAFGGVRAQWTPAFNSASNNGLNVTVQPLVSKIFTATITDSAGCSSKDSIQMKVINPLTLKVVSPVVACPGYNVQLFAAGANTYQWNGNGLNSTASNPYVMANAAAVYQVIGYDAFNCFSDTAAVELQVMSLPSVQAGPDQKVIAGQEVTLVTTSTGDVVKWNWQPRDYLKCTNCPSPVSRPESSINYVVTVTNNAGCIATDTVRVEMICGSELIYVPTGFTPNGDNLNDRFAVHGSGIKIKRLAIFDRWGTLVFEKKDISPYDRSSSWDGTYKGEQMSSGSYVYALEAMCEKGEAFTLKGMVTLIR